MSDPRDYQFAIATDNLPPAADLRQYAGGIENQGRLGACSGHAAVSALEILLERSGQFRNLSRLFAYYIFRELNGTVSSDTGVPLRVVMKALNKYGICSETIWPYREDWWYVTPNADAFKDASSLKVERYERITSFSNLTIPLIQGALARGLPVVAGIDICPSLNNLRGSIDTQNYKGTFLEPYYSSHAICIVGYNSRGLIIENSWGNEWGDNGYFLMPYEVVQKDLFDAWVATKVTGINLPNLWREYNSNTRVFISPGETFTVASSCKIIGNQNYAELKILPSAFSISTDGNIDKVFIEHWNISDLGFRVFGSNLLEVYVDNILICNMSMGGRVDRLELILKDSRNFITIKGSGDIQINNINVSTTGIERIA